MNTNTYETQLDFLNTMYHSFRLLLIASNKIQKIADSKLEGITLRQHMILAAVTNTDPNDINIVNIAEILGTSKQNATRLVNSMINSGYLKSSPNTNDKRSLKISVTDLGNEMCLKNYAKSNEYILDIFSDFSITELKKLYDNLIKLVGFDEEKKEAFEESLKIVLNSEYHDEIINFLENLKKSYTFKE